MFVSVRNIEQVGVIQPGLCCSELGGYLNLEVRDDQALIVLNPTPRDYELGAIMRSAGGSGGGIGLPKRKLDAMAGWFQSRFETTEAVERCIFLWVF